MGTNLSRSSLFNKQKNKTSSVKSVLFIFLFFAVFTLLPSKLFAVSYVWNGATSSAWATVTNWTPNGNPGSAAGDVVSIPVVATQPILTVAPANALASITFTGVSGILTITAVTCTVTGAVTLNNLAASSTACTITGTGILSCASVIVGSLVTPTANRTTTMTSIITSFIITGQITLNSIRPGSRNNATFTHTSGTVTAAGITTVNTSTATSTYALGNSSPRLNLTGATPFTMSGTGTNTITLTGTGATVDYQYAAGNTTFLGAPAGLLAYRNLIISGGAANVKELGGATTISGTLSISDASFLTVPGFALTVTGTTTVGGGTSGTLTINNATGTKTFTGAVTINSGGSLTETAAAPLSFGNDVTISGTLTEFGAAVVGMAGSLTNNGTYTASTGVHTFSGTGKIISGSSAVTIPSLTINGTTTNNSTLTVSTVLAGASTLTNSVTSTLNLSGAGVGSCAITTLANAGIINRSAAGTTTTALANFTNTGTINISGSGIITGITNNAGGIVNHSGSSPITSFNNATATSTLNISTTPFVPSFTTLNASASGNTVNYSGAGAQTVKAVSYENLILSGSGAKSLLAGTLVLTRISIAPTGSATASVGAGLTIVVNSLLLGGTDQVGGTYGSTSSAATYQNNTYFAATTGILSVPFAIVSTAVGGDWATAGTWVGGVVPVAGNKVVIATTGAGAVTTSTLVTFTCVGLTINTGSILTMWRPLIVNGNTSITGTINFGSTNATSHLMTFSGAVTLNSGAVWNETSTGAISTFTFSNNIVNDATTFTALTGSHTFSGSGMTLSGGTITSIANVAVTGTYTNSGTLTVGTALSGTGTLTNGDGVTGTLNIGGTSTITALTASAANNTVNYTGVAQTVRIPTSGIYHHLTFSGSAAKTLNVGITGINGDFTLAGTATTTGLVDLTIGGAVILGAGTTFTAGAFTHNVAGNWINNGGTFTNAGSTINFNGTGAQSINSGGSSFNNFTITNTGGTCTVVANNITVAGTFTTNVNTTLDMGTNALIVNTVAHSGTLNTQNVSATPLTAAKTWGGLVEYNSASNQTVINGTYNNLVISNAGVKTILTATTVNCQTITFNDTATLDILGTGLFNILG